MMRGMAARARNVLLITSDQQHWHTLGCLNGDSILDRLDALRTFIDERYKLTVYYDRDYGELFDLAEDPHEVRNLWHDPAAGALKHDLIRRLLFAELGREPLPMPRIAGA